MCPMQQDLPDHAPENRDYHTLLHTQIYDYFLSVGMFSCGQALLNSDCNLQHQIMGNACRHFATDLHDTTPSQLDSGFGSSHSSPTEGPYPTDLPDFPRPKAEPALLYQWFCTLWDTLNSPQNDAIQIAMHDSLNLPPNLSQDPIEPQPIIWQDSLDFQHCPDVFDPLPFEATTLKQYTANWRPISPHSDAASIASSKRSENNLKLLSFQKGLGELIKHNEGIVRNLRSYTKEKPSVGSPETSKD